MTTDNRTNEQLSGISGQFTDEQVEAAARALSMEHAEWGYPCGPEGFKAAARAALVAAQGAAPQADGECLCYGADGVTEPKCPTCTVLPSSAVDDQGLYEAIDLAQRRWNGSTRSEPIATAITRAVLKHFGDAREHD